MIKLSPLAILLFGITCGSATALFLRLKDAVSSRLTASNYIILIDRLYVGQLILFFAIGLLSLAFLQAILKRKRIKKENRKIDFEV